MADRTSPLTRVRLSVYLTPELPHMSSWLTAYRIQAPGGYPPASDRASMAYAGDRSDPYALALAALQGLQIQLGLPLG